MRRLKVHVHLFYRYRLPLEPLARAYGYHHAESEALDITYSVDHPEGRLLRVTRRILKAIIGFDFIHAIRNRAAILEADVIWTHTEKEYLAVALLLLLKRRHASPALLAQTVWLLDRWRGLSILRRSVYTKLIDRADVLTTHSRLNVELCRKLWGREATQVFFGGGRDEFPVIPPATWRPHRPLRIAAIGNDRDRDWRSLIRAFANDPSCEVHLATKRLVWDFVPRFRIPRNFIFRPVFGLAGLKRLYEWADIVVVPSHPNYHASGITVILEAVASGKPVVATNAGGLEDYFSTESIAYTQIHSAASLRDAVLATASDPDRTLRRIHRAQRELVDKDLTTRGFARQHVRLTSSLFADRPPVPQEVTLPSTVGAAEEKLSGVT